MAFPRRPPTRWPLLQGRLPGRLHSGLRTCTRAMAPQRCFVLELPDCTLAHFALHADSPSSTDSSGWHPDPRLASLLGPPGRSYSLCLPVAAGVSCGERVQAARLTQRLLLQLRRDPFQQCRLSRLLCYSPDGRAEGIHHGFLLRDPHDGPATRQALLQLLGQGQEATRLHLGEFDVDPHGELWQRLWAVQDGEQQQVDCARVVPAREPLLHPAVPDLPSSAVFPDLATARAVLEACTPYIPEARAVLNMVDQCPQQAQKGKFHVIVIEGLDATGKTTVTQAVSDALKAVLLKSPPACISQWRKIFDDEPTIVRRAFYSLGNYIVASEIARESIKSPVIVDRYWHSTATYAIATEVSGGLQHLPPAHHPVYQWPEDLLKPDLVLLLTVSPEERARRLQGRGVEKTQEEVQLEVNSIFRQKVEESYRRMENPACHVVDASPSQDKVLHTVLSLIHHSCCERR
ncbi:UMP-CMP kinase 2, mitochondrial [Ochotona curzoniae]|uniref:UMP-CMP kinase 2, mitochondrial n=1 Tax=Ochotona curzoniae TaxID=130825 RepID=UPI001B347890|nr:UMP-CMP kinase 2, mitochondrial [Ochotona curzoniae]